jgi:hypothetical protein
VSHNHRLDRPAHSWRASESAACLPGRAPTGLAGGNWRPSRHGRGGQGLGAAAESPQGDGPGTGNRKTEMHGAAGALDPAWPGAAAVGLEGTLTVTGGHRR